MSTNKNALLRYQILDRCFSDFNKKYDIDDLLEKVNEVLFDLYNTEVSIRQIRDDIKYMRDRLTYNAPIKAVPYDGKKCYYQYTDKDFSIFNNNLSVDELNKLRSTIEMLSRFRGVAGNAWLEEVISNLEYRLGVKSNNINAVAFEQNEQLRGLEYLSELIDSIINHQPLEITYRNYSSKEEKKSIVHPYHLKQYNNRWFLFGLEENETWGNHITNMALDRIIGFSHSSNTAFISNESIDFSTYFKDIVGVTIPKDHPTAENVILKFDEARFPYTISKPIHPTQKVINEDEKILQITVRPNKELESLIFSFGPQVEIIEPQWFRKQVEEKISKTLKKYLSMKNDCTDDI